MVVRQGFHEFLRFKLDQSPSYLESFSQVGRPAVWVALMGSITSRTLTTLNILFEAGESVNEPLRLETDIGPPTPWGQFMARLVRDLLGTQAVFGTSRTLEGDDSEVLELKASYPVLSALLSHGADPWCVLHDHSQRLSVFGIYLLSLFKVPSTCENLYLSCFEQFLALMKSAESGEQPTTTPRLTWEISGSDGYRMWPDFCYEKPPTRWSPLTPCPREVSEHFEWLPPPRPILRPIPRPIFRAFCGGVKEELDGGCEGSDVSFFKSVVEKLLSSGLLSRDEAYAIEEELRDTEIRI